MIRRRRHVRRESANARRRREAYQRIRSAWFADPSNRLCRFPFCRRRATDVHHKRGRLGLLLTDTRFWIPLCRRHHAWVGANPNQARELGLLALPGEWRVCVVRCSSQFAEATLGR